MNKILFDKSLKKLQFEDLTFNTIALNDLPSPADLDNDTFDFIDIYNKQLSKILGSKLLESHVISPEKEGLPYTTFAFVESTHIIPLLIENSGNFKLWMEDFFGGYFEQDEQNKKSGKYDNTFDPQYLSIIRQSGNSVSAIHRHKPSVITLYTNTGSYLYDKAPKTYKKTQFADEKTDFMNLYKNTMGSKLDLEILNTIFSLYLDTETLKPNPPQDHFETYKEFESLSGYPFPKELKSLFTIHNGIENTGFLTAQQVLNEWKGWKKIYDDVNWTLENLTSNNYSDGNKTLGIYTNPYWIPFIDKVGGNFIAIDFAPGTLGTSGQIIAFGSDTDTIVHLANDLEDYLLKLSLGELSHNYIP